MNRIRVLVIAFILAVALAAAAQQQHDATAVTSAQAGKRVVVPTPEAQLKSLGPRLELTSEQQQQIKPMLQELHAGIMKLVQAQGLSHDELTSQLRGLYYKADARVRTVLNDDQKKKLDQVEQEPHPELHVHMSDAQ